MKKCKFLTLTHLLVLAAAFLFMGSGYGQAQTESLQLAKNSDTAITQNPAKKMTQAQRQAAADRQAAQRLAVAARQSKQGKKAAPLTASESAVGAMAMPMPGGIPDYVGVANWANSPIIRKFVDTLPGLGPDANNNLNQYIPVAVADVNTYPGSDYYEIAVVEYTQQFHSDLPPTKLRGYVQLNDPAQPMTRDANGVIIAWPQARYLGPVIIAQKDRPIRIKFTNLLPTGVAGDLFIPVDTTVMGAGMGPLGMDAMPMNYTQNRATLHLHGGRTPWISDGTPHQWITPAGEMTPYPKGVSVSNVPDMPDPGDGSQTFFYTNQQSARLMFYHDHSYGITRLNVYAGEAAGYLLTDTTEQDLVTRGIIPAEQIPLIIQDKGFVDANTVRVTDPTWNWGTGTPDANGVRPPVTGDLWYPHVYVPAQNPEDISGANAFGRWHYGPWFFPPTTGIEYPPVPNPYYDPINAPWQPTEMPGVPNPSMPGESFFDIAMVNGTAYPTLSLEPKTYRFRILNAANDRFFNLHMYVADPCVITADGRINTEVKMVPAAPTAGFPDTWPTDGRAGGVPDPTTAGPSWIQIGTEGGFLPKPAVIPAQPIVWNLVPTTFDFGNVYDHSLLVAPAERADVIVDFSAYAGKTLIVYNDAPAAFPALDERYDYYTGAPDLRDTGGYGVTLPDGNTAGPLAGFSPNTRTIMQIKIADANPAPAFDVNALNAEFASTATKQGVFERSQPPIIVAQAAYNSTYNKTFPTRWPFWGYARIQDWSMQFKTIADTNMAIDFKSKAIHDEMGAAFDEYGRMSGKLGLEMPNVGPLVQNFNLQNYVDPATEIITASPVEGVPVAGDGTQIWRITHNGVDTHPIHFHLFDVQLLNRVGWDGAIRLPDRNELGWKDTVRMSPLEDTIVALRAVAPQQPFGIPDSVRPLNPAEPIGSMMEFSQIDPYTGDAMVPAVTNQIVNFGWEYVWHCHILSHEEMDMMRPIAFNVPRSLATAPVLTAVLVGNQVNLTWTDTTPPSDPLTLGNPANEIGFRIERATGITGVFATVGKALANATVYTNTLTAPASAYRYRIVAFNTAGDSMSNIVTFSAPGAPTSVTAFAGTSQATVSFNPPASIGSGPITLYTVTSIPGNITATGASSPITVTGLSNSTAYSFRVTAKNVIGTGPASGLSNTVRPMAAPTNLRATTISTTFVILGWNDNSGNEQGFYIEQSANGGATWTRVGQTAANTATFRPTGLITKTTYLYRVQAYNTNGLSNYSNTLTVTTR